MVTPKRAEATCLMALRRQIAVCVGLEALFVFAALAGVRLAANAVHGDGQRLVRFLADRAKRHRAGGEALHDFLRRLDFFKRHWFARLLDLHQAAQRAEIAALLVDQIGVFLKRLEALPPAPHAAAC